MIGAACRIAEASDRGIITSAVTPAMVDSISALFRSSTGRDSRTGDQSGRRSANDTVPKNPAPPSPSVSRIWLTGTTCDTCLISRSSTAKPAMVAIISRLARKLSVIKRAYTPFLIGTP
jgi:hypothetical protein